MAWKDWIGKIRDTSVAYSYAAFETAKYVWNHGLVKETAYKSTVAALETTEYLLEQPAALLRAIKYSSTNQEAGKRLYELYYLIKNGTAAIAIINMLNRVIQSQDPDYKDSDWVSSVYLLHISLNVIDYGVFFYKWRKISEQMARNTILATTAPYAFNAAILSTPSSSLCDKNCDNSLQAMGSSLSEIVQLQVNNGAISLFEKFAEGFPGMQPVATLSGMLVRGRAIIRYTSPETCPKHRGIDSKEAFALGLTHFGMVRFIQWALESSFGINPEDIYGLNEIVFILSLAISAQIKHRVVKKGEGTFPFDPLDILERSTDWCLEAIAKGVFIKLPALLEGQESAIDWKKYYNNALWAWDHPGISRVKDFLIPEMFQNIKNFTRDPVVAENWALLCDRTEEILGKIIELTDDPSKMQIAQGNASALAVMGKAARLTPKLATLLKKAFGVPVTLTEHAQRLSGEEGFRKFLIALHQGLYLLKNSKPIEIVSRENMDLRKVDQTSKIIEEVEKDSPIDNSGFLDQAAPDSKEVYLETALPELTSELEKSPSSFFEDYLSLPEEKSKSSSKESPYDEVIDLPKAYPRFFNPQKNNPQGGTSMQPQFH